MDGLGYNWGSTSQDLDSPPTYSSNEYGRRSNDWGTGGGRSGTTSNRGGKSTYSSARGGYDDVYDFDITQDDYEISPEPKKATRSSSSSSSSSASSSSYRGTSSGGAGGGWGRSSTGAKSIDDDEDWRGGRNNDVPLPSRRKSTDERTKEILERNQRASIESSSEFPSKSGKVDSATVLASTAGGKASTTTTSAADAGLYSSWKSDWEDIMEGVHSPEQAPRNANNNNNNQLNSADSSVASARNISNNNVVLGQEKGTHDDSYGDSSFGDSFELSAADLEVGAIAARRAKEKTSDRRRRMSLNEAPHANKPEPRERETIAPRITASPDVHAKSRRNNAGGMQMSAALSSIYRSTADELDDEGRISHRYGSLENSDGDLYKMLAGSKERGGEAYNPNHRRRSESQFSDVTQGSGSDEDNAAGRYRAKSNSNRLRGNSGEDDIRLDEQNEDNDEDSGDSTLAQSHGHGKDNDDDDEGAEYSLDEFEQDNTQDLENTKRSTINNVAAASQDPLEMIKQRWLAPVSIDETLQAIVGSAAETTHAPSVTAQDNADDHASGTDPVIANNSLDNNNDESTDSNEKRISPFEDVVAAAAAATSTTINDVSAPSRTSSLEASMTEQHHSAIQNYSNEDDDDDDNNNLQLLKNLKDIGNDVPNTADSTSPLHPPFSNSNSTTSDIHSVQPSILNEGPQIVSNMVATIGNLNLATSVPPPAPPIMSESVEIAMLAQDSIVDSAFRSVSSGRIMHGDEHLGLPIKMAAKKALSIADVDNIVHLGSASSETESNAFSGVEREQIINSRKSGHTSMRSAASRYDDKSKDTSMLEGNDDEDEGGDGFEKSIFTASVVGQLEDLSDIYQKHQLQQTGLQNLVALRPDPQPIVFQQQSIPVKQVRLSEENRGEVANNNSERKNHPESSSRRPFGNQNSPVTSAQQKLHMISATEVDLSLLGYVDSTSSTSRSTRNQTARSGSRLYNTKDVDLSKPLPVIPPSSLELHAHLAMLQASHKRMAAAALSRVNNRKKSEDELTLKGDQKGQLRARSTSAGRRTSGNAVAVQRLEQGTAKLARQFEELEKEMQHLKSTKSETEIAIRANLQRNQSRSLVGNTSANNSTPGRNSSSNANQKSGGSSSIPRPAKKDFGKSRDGCGESKPRINRGKENNDVDNLDGSTLMEWAQSSWDREALRAIKHIVNEGTLLSEKEKELEARENALNLRESFAKIGSQSSKIVDNVYANLLPVPPVQSPETVDIMNTNEIQLTLEINALKATIFELRQKEEDRNLDIRPPKSSRNAEIPSVKSLGENGEEVITIAKVEYDRLIAECASQEVLIAGFQKENEKLVKENKQRELAESSRKAQYFDQQENLNKELNRLRNAVEGDTITPVSTIRKSADALRAELNTDATIRALRERLAIAESGAGMREKELQTTIDKLRADYRQLATESAFISRNVTAYQAGEQQTIDDERKKHSEEINELRSKLAWYAENQELIENSENTIVDLKASVATLKTELKRRGVDSKTINALLDPSRNKSQADDEKEADADISMFSTTGKTNAGKTTRNPADIKKIKELEKTLSELQESIVKRHPDSVASLIRAAKTSDSVQIERKKQAQVVAETKGELTAAKEDYDRRLRSMRQEFEKVKIGYQTRISELESTLASGAGASAGVGMVPVSSARPSSSGAKNTAKTLPQAQTRIRELEDEIEKVRTFYTKKVEEVQRKADAQMRAFKRGGNSDETGEPIDVEGDGNISAETAAMYEQRLSLLEGELLRTAEELGQAKGTISSLTSQITLATAMSQIAAQQQQSGISLPTQISQPTLNQQLQPPMPPPPPSYAHPLPTVLPETRKGIEVHQSNSRSDAEIELEIQQRVEKLRQLDAEKMSYKSSADAMIERELRAEKDRLSEQLQQRQQQWNEERESLWKKLHDEEMRAAQLSMETSRLRMQSDQPQSPQLAQFMHMEQQLSQLETRLERRERELMSAVEEGKVASRMEVARLQALHTQELREKEEQLTRFQSELEQLVYTLRQWQYAAASTSTSTSSSHQMGSSSSGVMVP